jgi:hypothetical protein
MSRPAAHSRAESLQHGYLFAARSQLQDEEMPRAPVLQHRTSAPSVKDHSPAQEVRVEK